MTADVPPPTRHRVLFGDARHLVAVADAHAAGLLDHAQVLVERAIERELPEQIVVHDGNVLADELSSADFAESGLAADGLGTQGTWTILFFPDGTATSAVVTLRNEYGRAIDVSLRGLTGAVLVGEAYHTDVVTTGAGADFPSSSAGGPP